jgi:uncharacterized protein involved in exopolysaccharide biosynthesis
MSEEQKSKDVRFSDYLYILYKWRKFLIINLLIITAISVGVSFLIPVKYKATSVVIVPPESSFGLGGLAGLVGGKSSAASLGSKLLGVSGSSEDVLLGILNSRTALTSVIEKYSLKDYYEITDGNMDKILKAFSNDLSFEPNEFGMIEISVINKSPELSAEIANHFYYLLDSLNIQLNIEQAKNNRIFIEQRYFQNLTDLKQAEDSLYNFQKKYGIVAVPEQLEVAVKASAEIEAQLAAKEMAAFFMKQQFGEHSPHYQGALLEVNLLKDRVKELKNADKLTTLTNVLFPFKKMPDISIQYLRAFREVEIQQTILEIIVPLYEQAKVEEQKSIPTVFLLDKAVPPQLKDSPKKALIVLIATFLGFFALIAIIFIGERNTSLSQYRNPLEEKSARFYIKVLRFYRMKF